MNAFKTSLFSHCYIEYKNYTRCPYPAQKEEYRLKFSALYTLIEDLKLEDEYQEFKKYSEQAR